MSDQRPTGIAFLHTSPVHVATFEALVAELAPGTRTVHIVDEALLAAARVQGITAEVAAQVAAALTKGARQSAVLLCTCSTIGACAESIGLPAGQPVLRVDRAMAERAVALGSRITLAAALESTLPPTRQLLEEVAEAAGNPVVIMDCFCAGAWEKFEAGDLPGYHRAIAKTLQAVTDPGDVIVLAQASMAPAALLCPAIDIPILSSPRLGVEKALALALAGTELYS